MHTKIGLDGALTFICHALPFLVVNRFYQIWNWTLNLQNHGSNYIVWHNRVMHESGRLYPLFQLNVRCVSQLSALEMPMNNWILHYIQSTQLKILLHFIFQLWNPYQVACCVKKIKLITYITIKSYVEVAVFKLGQL